MNERSQGGTTAASSGGVEHPLRGAETPARSAAGRKLAWSRPSVRVMDIERTLSGQKMVTYLEGGASYMNVHS